ncbi:MAG: PilZ domain-containing protein [Deltaproteobacteria bacterium]|nr:PilZ domain-containing protein [Deltaproteobacteria bacterium]
MAGERKSYNTTLRTDLTMRLRILAAQQGKRQNDLLEEAIQTLLQKYKENSPSTKKSLAPKQEKRVHPRTKVSWPVSIISTKGLTKGAIKNISKGGALIRCRELPKTDESLALSIELSDHLLNVSAIVEKVRLNIDDSDTASPSYDLAVRFLGIDVDQRRHLYNALEN